MINSPEKNDPPTSAIVNTSTNSGDVNLNVVLNRLNYPPSVSSESDIELIPPEKVALKQTNSNKLNTIISFPHQFPGLSYPLVQNDKWIDSTVPSDSKIVRKINHPEVLSLKLVEANIEKDPIIKTIRDTIRDKNPRAKDIITRLGQNYAQHYNDFAVRENCLWMDGRLAIPKDMSSAVLNRLHFNHHERDKMFAAAKDVWIPLMHRNIAATAKYCKSCLEAGKNLKPDIPKSDMGETYVPKEPNDLVQLNFWGPVNYVKGRKKYVLVAIDTFSHWPSAYVCSSNKSKNVIKFLRKYINTHGNPRKLHMDQPTGFFSYEIQLFCNYEGIELIKSPVKDHRAMGMVERTIESIKNYVLTYLQENKNCKFGVMISRALSALRFVPHSKTKIAPFEAYHGREAITALRNLTKKPSLKNLNWNNVVNQKLSCLDKAGNLPDVELTLNWDKRSNLVYAPENRKTPIILDDEELTETDPKAQEVADPKETRHVPKAPAWLKRHKTSSTTVYQRTGKTDPKDPRRYKRLPLKIEKLTKHTVQMEKGSLLRRSGISFRSAAEESQIEDRSDACTPGPSKTVKSTPGPIEPTKCTRKAKKDQIEMENARKSMKHRIEEYTADESEDDEDSEWEIERDEPARITASGGENVPSGTDKNISPKTVGGKRRKGEAATRKSTRQRRGVDKMGVVMIHRIEHK